jgi:hypothetical protein
MIRLLLFILRLNWSNYRPADCLPNNCFCEAIGNGLIRQPINAYTNIAYVLAGIIILIYLARTKRQFKLRSPISDLPRKLFVLFGIACILVGIGSFLYHASFIFLGEEMDDDSMYLIGAFMLFFELAHHKSITTRQFIGYYLALNLLLEVLIFFIPVVRGAVFAILIIASLSLVEISIRNGIVASQRRQFYTAIGLFGVAYFIWILDKTHLLCNPNSLYQGHAVWHLLSALAALMYFFYMDREYIKRDKLSH